MKNYSIRSPAIHLSADFCRSIALQLALRVDRPPVQHHFTKKLKIHRIATENLC
ncbi:MAG: hypothetical protein HC895_25295 [Leptolyngbyaceae cyanobacterium SM1_3_5]|nr:hypothetical protein [Leptolyngbyaceae cyanobacterium SM1_3_5]